MKYRADIALNINAYTQGYNMHYELTNRIHGHKITAQSAASRDNLQLTKDKSDNLPIWQVTKEFDPVAPAKPRVELSDDELLALLEERGLKAGLPTEEVKVAPKKKAAPKKAK